MYVQFLRRWLALLMLGPIVGGVAGYLVVRSLPSVYEATVTLVVQPGDTGLAGGQIYRRPQDLAQTYAETVRTRAILTEAATQVGLAGLPERELESRVQARRVAGTQLLRISVDDTDPTQAATLANTVAQVFVNTNAQAQTTRYAASADGLTRLVNQLQSDIDARTETIATLSARPASPERDAQLALLQSALAQVRATQDSTLKSYADLRVSEARNTVTASVIDPAVPPDDAIRPNRSLTTLLAAMAGLIAALGIALLAESLDDRLRDPRRVVASTGVPTIGIVPRAETPQNLRRPSDRRSVDRFRLLASSLPHPRRPASPRTLLIASAGEGEGKSTIAANLAIVLAQAGERVILVDADFDRPAQTRLFELPERGGLSNLLVADAVPVERFLHATWIQTLRVLTAGDADPDASALLASKHTPTVLSQLAELCDTLIIDTPPLMARPDALFLSPHVDDVVLVVDARRTRGRDAARAVELLQSFGCTGHKRNPQSSQQRCGRVSCVSQATSTTLHVRTHGSHGRGYPGGRTTRPVARYVRGAAARGEARV